MKIKATYIEKIPSYAVCYIANGDVGELDQEEIKLIDNFTDQFPNAIYNFTEEEEFCWHPAFGLASNCYETTITVPYRAGKFTSDLMADGSVIVKKETSSREFFVRFPIGTTIENALALAKGKRPHRPCWKINRLY